MGIKLYNEVIMEMTQMTNDEKLKWKDITTLNSLRTYECEYCGIGYTLKRFSYREWQLSFCFVNYSLDYLFNRHHRAFIKSVKNSSRKRPPFIDEDLNEKLNKLHNGYSCGA